MIVEFRITIVTTLIWNDVFNKALSFHLSLMLKGNHDAAVMPIPHVAKSDSSSSKLERPTRPKTAHGKKADVHPFFIEIQKKLREQPAAAKSDGVSTSTEEKEQMKPVRGLLQEKLPPPKPSTAHKRYSPVYACANTLLAKKWDDATWRRHREKIKTMKACIDNAHSVKASASREMKKNIAKQGLRN
jgi:hypothetical protein